MFLVIKENNNKHNEQQKMESKKPTRLVSMVYSDLSLRDLLSEGGGEGGLRLLTKLFASSIPCYRFELACQLISNLI